MKRKMRKFLLTLSAALLLVTMTVGVTVAYLTDADSVKNTFTVGKVNIKLDEAIVDEYGVPTGRRTEATEGQDVGNAYKLIPGHTYTKDPMVTVIADSEDSYIRIKVTVNNQDELKAIFGDDAHAADYYVGDVLLLQNFVDWNSAEWVYEDCTAGEDTATYEFRYYETVNTLDSGDKELGKLFTQFTLPGFVKNAQLDTLAGLVIDIKAEAVQADGFGDDADAAWAAFDAQQ